MILDGNERGLTPLTLSIDDNEHMLELRQSGYKPYWIPIRKRINPGNLRFDIILDPISAPIILNSTPSAASIRINAVLHPEKTPVFIDQAFGDYTIVFEKMGYSTKRIEHSIKDDRPLEIHAALESIFGSVQIITDPSGAEGFIDDVFQGISPIEIKEIVKGSHDLRIVHKRYRTYTQSFLIKAGEHKTITLPPLHERPGCLDISSIPKAALIYHGDTFLGKTPTVIKDLYPGFFRIKLSTEGFDTEYQSVRISPGETSKLDIRLNANDGNITLSTEPPGCLAY